MSLRIVLLAEGTRETGNVALSPRPGDSLDAIRLGPAHVLVRRCLVAAGLPEGAIRFVQPLRTGTGRAARGSDLLDRATLRRLLAWPDPTARPALAVIMIDADGEKHRRTDVLEWTEDAMLPRVVSVAVQEFEAWLLADEVAVSRALALPFPTQPAPEGLRPREAKALLANAIGAAGRDPVEARRTIAEVLDLGGVSARCPAFDLFRKDLGLASGRLFQRA